MKAIVSIIMGSTSDMPVMEKATKFLDQMEIPFEINALSAHRTPQMVENFATNAKNNGIKVIIAGAGGGDSSSWSHAAFTTLPVIGFHADHQYLLMDGILFSPFYKCLQVYLLPLLD